MVSLSIVFPAYNEEGNILNTVSNALKSLPCLGYKYDILIVDNASTDKTPQIIDELAAKYESIKVIHHPQNLGYAASTRTGLKNASGDVIFIIDSDGQHTLEDIPKFVEKIQQGYGLVIGWKKPRHDPLYRLLLASGYNFFFRLMFNVPFHDIDCGFKAYTKDLAYKITIELTNVPVGPEIIIKTKYLGYKIAELPVKHFPRKKGTSEFSAFKTLTVIHKVFKSFLFLKKKRTKGALP